MIELESSLTYNRDRRMIELIPTINNSHLVYLIEMKRQMSHLNVLFGMSAFLKNFSLRRLMQSRFISQSINMIISRYLFVRREIITTKKDNHVHEAIVLHLGSMYPAKDMYHARFILLNPLISTDDNLKMNPYNDEYSMIRELHFNECDNRPIVMIDESTPSDSYRSEDNRRVIRVVSRRGRRTMILRRMCSNSYHGMISTRDNQHDEVIHIYKYGDEVIRAYSNIDKTSIYIANPTSRIVYIRRRDGTKRCHIEGQHSTRMCEVLDKMKIASTKKLSKRHEVSTRDRVISTER